MEFYFCGKYINTDADDEEVERDMYAALPCFSGSDDQYGYEKWENNLENFFSYFILTSEQKCHYARMKLVGKAYWWWKDNHSSCRCWFRLQDSLRTRYAPHLLFAEFRETLEDIRKGIEEYKASIIATKLESSPVIVDMSESEPEVIDEPEPESEVATELESEPTVIDESESAESESERIIVDEPELESEVADEPEPEITMDLESEPTVINDPNPEPEREEFLVEMSEDLPATLAMELVASTPALRVLVFLRSPDVYDSLQILLEASDSQELGFLMVPSTIDPVFSKENLSQHVACDLFKAPSTAAGWSRRPVPPPPPWFSRNTEVLILRPPPWPD